MRKEGKVTMTQHINNMPGQALVDFGRVDQSTYPQHFVQFLEQSQTNDMIQVIKQQSYSLLAASAGQSLLDIGCGIGDDVRAFARLVGKQGRAVGVDRSQTMIDAANKRSTGCDLPGEFYVGDVHHLKFADATFDGCFPVLLYVSMVLVQKHNIKYTGCGGKVMEDGEDIKRMTQQSIEDRLVIIERKIAELEAERAQLRSLATLQIKQTELRAIFDAYQEYIADQIQAFKEDVITLLDLADDHNNARFHELQEDVQSLQAGQHELQATVQSLQAGQHELHASVQSLHAGMDQVLAILTGHAHLND